MAPDQELFDELFRDKVRQARVTPPAERLLDGLRLFDQACSLAMAGIRQRHPDADEAQVRQMLARQLAILRRLDECP